MTVTIDSEAIERPILDTILQELGFDFEPRIVFAETNWWKLAFCRCVSQKTVKLGNVTSGYDRKSLTIHLAPEYHAKVESLKTQLQNRMPDWHFDIKLLARSIENVYFNHSYD